MNQQMFNRKDSTLINTDSQLLCMYTQALQTPYECLSNFIDVKIKVSQHANKRWEDEKDRKTALNGKLFCTSSESLDLSSNLKCFRPLIIKCLEVSNYIFLLKLSVFVNYTNRMIFKLLSINYKDLKRNLILKLENLWLNKNCIFQNVII